MDYDVNQLFTVLKNYLPGFAPDNWCSLQFTSDSSFNPNETDHSFHKAHSSLDGEGGNFQPGNVLDVLFNKNSASYFASIFFDKGARRISYRLVRLGRMVDTPLKDAFYRLAEIQSKDDRVVDQGELPFGDDHVATAGKITNWLRYQVASPD